MAVMVAASYEDTNTQLCLGRKALEHMAERIILRGEKSMDLLQGLLIFITWSVHRPNLKANFAESC